MSEGYIEASVEDPKSGARISVIQSPRKPTRIVQFDNWVEQEACSDFLAGIIVRGIRSLEEERRTARLQEVWDPTDSRYEIDGESQDDGPALDCRALGDNELWRR